MPLPMAVPLIAGAAGLVGSLFGGNDAPRPTTSTTSGTSRTFIDPASQDYLSQFLRPLAQQAAGQLTSAPRLPGADPALSQAIGGLSNAYAGPGAAPLSEVAGLPSLMALLGSGSGFGGGSYSFSGGGGGGGAAYTPGQVDINRIQEFFNPFQDEVIGGLQGDFDRLRSVTSSRAARQATAEGAFGGSRSAVLEAMGLRDVGNQEASTLAGVRSSGYESARNTALQEWMQGEQGRAQLAAANASASGQSSAASIGASQRMQEAMAQMAMQAGQFDISNELSRRLANQGNAMDAYRAQTGFEQEANRTDLSRLNSLASAGVANRDAAVQSQQDYLDRWIRAVGVGAQGMGPTGSTTTTNGTTRQTGGGTQFNPWEALMGGGVAMAGMI